MKTKSESSGTNANGLLTFKAGDKVTDKELATYQATVNSNAKAVCDGIANLLRKDGKTVKVTENSPGQWVIAVGASPKARIKAAQVVAAPNVTITVNASSADIPPTVNALNGFFGNWNAVAGLIATGAAFVAGVWALTVIRRP